MNAAGGNDRSGTGGIGVLGGTFDPIHNGHLRLALEMRQALALTQVLLIPAARPRLREPPIASIALRLRMVEAAVATLPGVEVSRLERQGADETRTFATLQTLRSQYRDRPLYLILGTDAFASFDQWYRYQQLLDLAHIAIALRPHAALPTQGPVAALLSARGTAAADLGHTEHGRIIVVKIPLLGHFRYPHSRSECEPRLYPFPSAGCGVCYLATGGAL